MKLTDKVMQRQDLVSTDMDGDIVMMDIQSGKYYKFGGVSGVIWQTIETQISIDALVEKLLAEYDIARGECESQTMTFIGQLVEKGLVIIFEE